MTSVGPALASAVERLGRQLRTGWPYVVLACAVVPLLWMAISVAVKAGLFDLSGPPNQGQIGAFLTFIGATLGTVATVFAALLTRGHNARERQRLRLETVIRSLESLPAEAEKSRMAGVLSTMVLLGQERIAMRVLLPAWDEGLVDHGTATWLIGQVLTEGRYAADGDRVDEETRNEAAGLLVDRADQLADAETGRLHFPGYFMRRWKTRKRIPAQVKLDLLHAMGEMLASREKSWWSSTGNLPHWPTAVLLECVRKERDPRVRSTAAVLLDALQDAFPEQFRRHVRESAAIHARATAARRKTSVPAVHAMIADRIKVDWRPEQPELAGRQ